MNTFECNKNKARSNFEKHSLRFTEACRMFNGHVLTLPSQNSNNFIEKRFITIGKINSQTAITVIWTNREQNIRVISARKASKKERGRYDTYIQKTIN